MIPPATTSATTATTDTPSAPWYAHVIIGGMALGAGIALYALGAVTIGEALVVSAIAFLGVGSGVAAAS
jgi:hypothetical protein